jgi:hypothetical protein
MKPVRWLVLAIAAACLGFLAMPGTARAAVHHAAKPLGSTTLLQSRLGSGAGRSSAPSSQNTPRRSPAHPSNRSKTHHSNSGNRGRGHSPYGLLPPVPDANPDDDHGLMRLGIVQDHCDRLNRMLESRGPPRAGPSWNSASPGYLPPSPVYLSSANSIASTAPQLVRKTPPNRLTPASFFGTPLAARLEGTAAGIDTPSFGGFSL